MYDSHYHDCHENFNIFVKTILTKKLWSVKPKISLCVGHKVHFIAPAGQPNPFFDPPLEKKLFATRKEHLFCSCDC